MTLRGVLSWVLSVLRLRQPWSKQTSPRHPEPRGNQQQHPHHFCFLGKKTHWALEMRSWLPEGKACVLTIGLKV